jgi:DNA-directed RNA polymerase specialized sigma24 family protein
MSVEPSAADPLESPWPPFLDHLDDDPEGARAAFCDFAYRLLQVCPPRFFASIPPDDRADAIQEILIHCLRDGCRVLRRYQSQGRPFAAWFLAVAANKARDIVLPGMRVRKLALDEVPETALPNPGPSEGDPLLRRKLSECLAGMGEKCRALLTLFADGLKPAEIAEVAAGLLGYEEYSNRQASDDLRYCKDRLAKALAAAGVRWP